MRVIVLTKDARLTDLPEDRYREIWEDGIDRGDPVKIERLREKGLNPAEVMVEEPEKVNYSLTKFVKEVLKSGFNKSLWSQWLKSMDDPKAKRVTLNVGMKNELRRLVGLDPLPVQVVDAFDDVDPNAEIVEIIGDDSDGAAHRVIKLKTRAPVNIACNGTVRVLDTGNDVQSRVTPLTLAQDKSQSATNDKGSARKPGWVTTSRATVEQNDRRAALEKTWQEVYEAGLKALEEQVAGDE
jgi:hypothetical protein